MWLFRSEEDAPAIGGETIPIKQLNALARRWYGDRLDPDWRPRSRAQSQAILRAVGLTGEFWLLR